jgi:peptidoglycan/LPS O-acetylase OafA/YrhL
MVTPGASTEHPESIVAVAPILAGTPAQAPQRAHAKSRYIPTLDGWRAVAISLVIVSHGLEERFPFVTKLGALGVGLFFALSGYLICTLLLGEHEETGGISLWAFYVRRVFRILPPAIVYLLFLSLLGATDIVTLRRHELLTALYAANYVHTRSWFTEHFWSLSIEEHFYLFWPATLALARPRRAKYLAAILLVVILLYRPWGELHSDPSAYQHTDMRLDSFLLPCILAILLRQTKWREFFTKLVHPLVCAGLFGVILAASIFAASHPAYGNAQKFLQAAILPLFIVSTVLRPAGLMGAVLEWPILRWIGRISYSLYLWQQLFLFHQRPGGPPFFLRLPLIVAFAAASHYLVERPMIRQGQRLSKRVAKRAAAA